MKHNILCHRVSEPGFTTLYLLGGESTLSLFEFTVPLNMTFLSSKNHSYFDYLSCIFHRIDFKIL